MRSIQKSIWKDRPQNLFEGDKTTKWYEVHTQNGEVYMHGVNCFICGKRIKGELVPYGNYFVDEKCWNTTRYH